MVSMLTTLFTSLGFLIGVSAVILLIIGFLLEFEKEGWATSVFSIFLAIVLWSNKELLGDSLLNHKLNIIAFFITYIIVGVLWSFLKWRSYVKNIFNSFKKIKEEFLESHSSITNENLNLFNNFIEEKRLFDKHGYRLTLNGKNSVVEIVNKITPIASKKKAIITSWIAYWPASLCATFLNDPLRKFFEWVYESISGVYEKITKSYKEDLLKS